MKAQRKSVLYFSILMTITLFFTILHSNSYAQCGIKAFVDKDSIVCGDSFQLNALTKWKKIDSLNQNTLHDLWFFNKDTGIVIGDSGIIYKTINGGTQWTSVASGTFASLNKIFFVNDSVGFIVGNYDSSKGFSILMKTSNRGLSWTQKNETQANIKVVFFLNDSIGFIAGENNLLKKTINGGLSWTQMTLPGANTYHIGTLYFTSVDTGYFACNSGIFRTYNAGNNWVQKYPNAALNFYSMYFSSGKRGYIAGSGGFGFIIYSEDGFDTDTILYSNTQFVNGLSFVNATVGFTAGYQSSNFKISGKNLTNLPADYTAGGIKAVFAINEKTAYGVGFSGKFFKYIEADSFLWSPSTNLSGITVQKPKVAPIQSGMYYIQGKTADGCISTDSIFLKVLPLKINAGSDKNIICGAHVQLDSILSNYTGSGKLTYSWIPSSHLDSSTIPNPICDVSDTTMYYAMVHSQNFCLAKDSVKIHVAPLIVFPALDSVLCGEYFSLHNSTNYAGSDSLNYIWSNGDLLNDSTLSNPLALVSNSQNFTVQVSSQNGCQAQGSHPLIMKAHPAPSICNVGVDNNYKNLIIWNKDSANGIVFFTIYKETNVSGQYISIGTQSADSICIFEDTASHPDIKSDKYKISATDSCGYQSALSAFHKTMHLTINQGMGNNWNLIWESYEGFTASTINIYRGTDSVNMLLIGSTAGTNTTFTDVNPPTGYLYYQVEIINPNGCYPDTIISKTNTNYNSSRSNVAQCHVIGIKDISIPVESFDIIPNPAKDIFWIKIRNTSLQAKITIFNSNGGIVKEYSGIENTVRIKDMNPGIYIVEMKTSTSCSRKRLVVIQ